MRVWDLSHSREPADASRSGHPYTNAKVLLVGRQRRGQVGPGASAVTEDASRPTRLDRRRLGHAAQAAARGEPSPDEIEREIWLWDFAGQADYRLIHQLYMDETALAVLVFDPPERDPFEGLAEWDRDLSAAARRPFRKLLVAGRCDRGGLMVSTRA